MVNITKLKEQLIKGIFYVDTSDTLLSSKVTNVLEADKNVLEILLKGGSTTVYIDKLQKVYSPGHSTKIFKWCYLLKNNQNSVIGYIGEPEEK